MNFKIFLSYLRCHGSIPVEPVTHPPGLFFGLLSFQNIAPKSLFVNHYTNRIAKENYRMLGN